MNYLKLKIARELANVSQTEAAAMSGVNQKDISLLEAGKKKFIPNEYIQFLYKVGVDINTLFDDNQELSALKSADTPTISNTIDANNTSNTAVNTYKKALGIASPTASATASPTRNLGLPHVVTIDMKGVNTISLVNVKARAGYLNGYGDIEYVERLPSYALPGFNNGTFRAFEVEGESMKPTLRHSDIVFSQWLESLNDIREDRVHVVVTKSEGIVIKRVLNRIEQYGYLVCKSDNIDNKHDYPNIKIYPEDILEVWYPRIYMSAEFKAPGDIYRRFNDIEATLEELKRLNGIK